MVATTIPDGQTEPAMPPVGRWYLYTPGRSRQELSIARHGIDRGTDHGGEASTLGGTELRPVSHAPSAAGDGRVDAVEEIAAPPSLAVTAPGDSEPERGRAHQGHQADQLDEAAAE
jgi:hypothetical protein